MNLGFDSRQVFRFERLLLVVNRGLLLRKRVAANSFLPFIFSSSVLHHRRFPFFVLGLLIQYHCHLFTAQCFIVLLTAVVKLPLHSGRLCKIIKNLRQSLVAERSTVSIFSIIPIA